MTSLNRSPSTARRRAHSPLGAVTSVALAFALSTTMQGCWLRSAVEVDDSFNVEVTVSGLVDGDRVAVAIDDDVTHHVFNDAVSRQLTLLEFVSVGTHALTVKVDRPSGALCGARDFAVDENTVAVGVDVNTFARCPTTDDADAGVPDAGIDDAGEFDAGNDDAGVIDAGIDDAGVPDAGIDDAGVAVTFYSIRERVTPSDCDDGCRRTTLIHDDGETEISGGGDDDEDDVVGFAAESDLALLVELVMSPAADLLFAGNDPSCPVVDPGQNQDTVVLRRTVRPAGFSGGHLDHEDVDVSGCDAGIVAQIRSRIGAIRSDILDD